MSLLIERNAYNRAILDAVTVIKPHDDSGELVGELLKLFIKNKKSIWQNIKKQSEEHG